MAAGSERTHGATTPDTVPSAIWHRPATDAAIHRRAGSGPELLPAHIAAVTVASPTPREPNGAPAIDAMPVHSSTGSGCVLKPWSCRTLNAGAFWESIVTTKRGSASPVTAEPSMLGRNAFSSGSCQP